jgi:phage gpG-like protein
MPVTIIGIEKLQGALKEVLEHVGSTARGRRKLMFRLGRGMRDATRRNITTQGDGTWKPLSRWTRAKTGRNKALITLRNRVKMDYNADQARVYFEKSSPYWDLTTHHTGRRSAAVRGKAMNIPLPSNTAGRISGAGSRLLIFNRKVSILPARKVWASKAQIEKETEKHIAGWLDELRAKVKR